MRIESSLMKSERLPVSFKWAATSFVSKKLVFANKRISAALEMIAYEVKTGVYGMSVPLKLKNPSKSSETKHYVSRKKIIQVIWMMLGKHSHAISSSTVTSK